MPQHLEISRKVALNECKKVFIQRYYGLGYEVAFENSLPAELRNKVDEETWTIFINKLNRLYSSATAVSKNSLAECALSFLTCYFSRLCLKSVWERRLEEAADFLTEMNNLKFIMHGFYICNPIEKGLRVLEVILLDEPAPRHSTVRASANNVVPPPLQPR